MIFKPFYRFDTGCAAYVFGCGGKAKCVVVDPHLDDVDTYAAFAKDKGMKIVRVVDTHIHADHRSGGRSLAKLVDAPYSVTRPRLRSARGLDGAPADCSSAECPTPIAGRAPPSTTV